MKQILNGSRIGDDMSGYDEESGGPCSVCRLQWGHQVDPDELVVLQVERAAGLCGLIELRNSVHCGRRLKKASLWAAWSFEEVGAQDGIGGESHIEGIFQPFKVNLSSQVQHRGDVECRGVPGDLTLEPDQPLKLGHVRGG
jgi:hypothetical protein